MEDQRLVQLAQDYGWVTKEQVDKATQEQQALADRGVERSLWFLMLDLGMVTDTQARDLRKYVSSASIKALEVEGYVLQGRIGSGGMGDVFRAVNAKGEEAAVKLLSSKLAKSAENVRRFQREARTSLKLHHPHITRSLASGEFEGQRYLVMELIKGPSLKQRLTERGRMPEDQAIVLLWQIASALCYAWARGILHRDVKPANLMLAPPRAGVAEPFCAKICDFGLAKVMSESGIDDESKGLLTGAGMALGTPHYMPPEQASGETNLDQRADIYSLAAAVYHALLGHTMHSGRSSTIIMYKQVTESADLDALKELGLSADLIRVLGRMLEKNRRKRFATWDEVLVALKTIAPDLLAIQAAAIAAVMGPPVQVAASGVAPAVPLERVTSSSEHVLMRPTVRAGRGSRRQTRMLLAAAVVLVVLVAVGAGVLAAGVLGTGSGQRVTPATIHVLLAGSAANRLTELVLEVGDYPGPWRFGVAHRGLTLRAARPGVRLVAGAVTGDAPLVRFEPGLSSFRLIGIAIVNPGGTALEALGGVGAELAQATITGNVVISGAKLTVQGLVLDGGLDIDAHSDVVLEEAVLRLPAGIRQRDGHSTLRRCQVTTGGRPRALITVEAGALELDAVVIDGGAATGIDLAPGANATLRDVLITGVATGVHADGARMAVVDGLTAQASETGLWWRGPRDPAWSWQRVRLQAPRTVMGIELPESSADGARPERLIQVPDSARRSP